MLRMSPLKSPPQRELVEAVSNNPELQTALVGSVKLNTLSNALRRRDTDQMAEAWALILQYYQPPITRLGKKAPTSPPIAAPQFPFA